MKGVWDVRYVYMYTFTENVKGGGGYIPRCLA